MADTAELVERIVTIRTAMKIEIDQIVFIKTSVVCPVVIVGKGRANRIRRQNALRSVGFSQD
jgi:hypothetical protein